MKPINVLTDNISSDSTAVALGFFDGVHLGHQELIGRMINFAKTKGLSSVIFTFDKAPKKILGQIFDGYLTTPEEKFDILTQTGVDEICYAPFTTDFANQSCEAFVKDILIDKLKAKAVFVGFNFSFGANKSGNSEFLKSELDKYGVECIILNPVTVEEIGIVSSSTIRGALKCGEIAKANKLLGRKFSFTGEVIHGDHRATEMGFPTANLLLKDSEKCLPPNGVYACYADTADGTYPAIVNIGYRPTFNKDTYLLEAHLCNYSGNLYGKTIRIRFLKGMRPEIKFPNMGALIQQIEKDRQALLNLM